MGFGIYTKFANSALKLKKKKISFDNVFMDAPYMKLPSQEIMAIIRLCVQSPIIGNG